MPVFDTEIFNWLILPLLIFGARILDVSLGTTRIIIVAKGQKGLASLIGFFEIIIWVLVSAQVLQSMDNMLYMVAYAGGFAMGNYVGISIEERLAIGQISLRLITNNYPYNFINKLRDKGFGVTCIEATGRTGKAYIIYSIINRKKYSKFEQLANNFDPNAFFAAEDIRKVKKGFFPEEKKKIAIRNFFPLRKIK